MSYVLHVWESPTPASVIEADRIQARLSEEKSAQNPKFVAFARALAQAPGPRADKNMQDAWSDEPLDGRTDRAVYAIGVRAERLLYDVPAARAYLSDGKVLALPGISSATQLARLGASHATRCRSFLRVNSIPCALLRSCFSV